jgi:hypothetical protein
MGVRAWAVMLAAGLLASCSGAGGKVDGRMKRFGSDAEFRAYAAKLNERQKGGEEVLEGAANAADAAAEAAGNAAPSAPPFIELHQTDSEPSQGCQPNCAPPPPTKAADAANPEITNNQNIGVDEGGIVKQVGPYLLVLQDGRIFSIKTNEGGEGLKLVDRLNVYRTSNDGTWYDEMLVDGNRILITAYSYEESATQISVFRIDSEGKLDRQGRFLMSSGDYYSSENYATRLVDNNLVIYTPHPVTNFGADKSRPWPWVRSVPLNGSVAATPLFGATDVYMPLYDIDQPVLHSVSICPLSAPGKAVTIDCRTTSFVGSWSEQFYVSAENVFLWTTPHDINSVASAARAACEKVQNQSYNPPSSSAVYRIPIKGGTPSVIGIEAPKSLSYLDVNLDDFDDSFEQADSSGYASLPPLDIADLRNRFLGDWLFYGGVENWDRTARDGNARHRSAKLVAVPVDNPAGAETLTLPHALTRIERTGNHATLVGYKGEKDVWLSFLNLSGKRPNLTSSLELPGRVESEGRSHAFNATAMSDGAGLIGLPTQVAHGSTGEYGGDSKSDMSYIGFAADGRLSRAGELGLKGRKPQPGYHCEVSCVAWYGNARPIFTGGRIFALLGTELVEGRLQAGKITEMRRVDLTTRL